MFNRMVGSILKLCHFILFNNTACVEQFRNYVVCKFKLFHLVFKGVCRSIMKWLR
jgi:hypothetical protein